MANYETPKNDDVQVDESESSIQDSKAQTAARLHARQVSEAKRFNAIPHKTMISMTKNAKQTYANRMRR